MARNKSYAFINITGLALGITTCLIIFLIIRHELSFDSFHKNASRTYRVVRDTKNSSGIEKSNVTPYPLANALRNDFQDVKNVTQFHFQENALVSIENEKSKVNKIVFADSSFFEIFGFEVLSGNPKKELAQPGKVFISEVYYNKLSDKKTRFIKIENLIDLEIVGIIKTPPTPSHIEFEMIVSLPSLTPTVAEKLLNFPLDNWGLNSSGFTYLTLPENISKEAMENRFPAFIKKYYEPEEAENLSYSLQPISKAHFNTEYSENPGTNATSPSMLIVLACIALFILLIACVNFINLSTALSIRKSKEVGVRKTLGALQTQLAFQHLSEAFLLTLIAAIISFGAAEWIVPVVGNFLEMNIVLNLFQNPQMILFLLGIVFFTAVLSGFYPAVVLSRFNPVQALKSKFSTQGNSSISLRKSLVVLQFFIAQVLIICTLVVSSQINFFRTESLGFSKEAVINVSLPENTPYLLESFHNKLATNGHIQDVSFSLGAPISDNNFGTDMYLTENGQVERYTVRIKPIDIHYKDVYGLELIEGRWFYESEIKIASDTNAAARHYAFVINETTVKSLGFSSAKEVIGKNVSVGINGISAPVIGVVKDFHSASLKDEMNSVIMMPFQQFYYDAGIKIAGGNTTATIKFIEEAWAQLYPSYLFEYTFLDEHIAQLYRHEERMFTLFEIFAGVAIFIGCLGLYGLASFMANQKTKEIAIRKTLGASVNQIVMLFSKEFVLLVLLAFVFAVPVAWYSMNSWLQEFAYRVEMGWFLFAAGMLITLVITFATVGYRSLMAAVSNPVNALKSE